MSLSKENLKYHHLIFFVSPILGLIYGLKSKQEQTIRWSIFGFVVIYGSLFNASFLGDGANHWGNVYDHYLNLDFSLFWEELKGIMVLNHSIYVNDDPYIHIVSYFVGTILNAPGLFFVAVGIVYAYFYSGVMIKLLGHINWNSKLNKFFFIFFLFALILWVSPLKMQTVRTWTGMWILLYAILSYYETKKTKYLILALVPPFVHIGYLAMAIPIWIVLFTGFRNPKVYFIIFVISMFVSNVVQQTGFNELASKTEVGASKINGYYNEGEDAINKEMKIERAAKGKNFYKIFESFGLHTKVLSGLIIFMFIFLRKNGFGNIENTLFSYGLAMAAFSNFFTSIFAVHNRGWHIAAVLILGLMVIFLSKQNLNNISFSFIKVRLPLTLFVLGLIPYVLYLISGLLSFSSPYLFLMPVVSWINPEMATNIRDVIGLFM